jgi:predicted AAA+ superfamily ATPase
MDKQIIRKVILDQKSIPFSPDWIERDDFRKVINYHNEPSVIVISGIRRCGKSTLIRQLSAEFPGYYLNFDDDRLMNFQVEDFQFLYETLIEVYGLLDVFYFDEIQNVPGWERFVRRLHDNGKKVYITGSNASLLSKELGTRLTGRHINLTLYPFSFREYLKFVGQSNFDTQNLKTTETGLLKKHFQEYLFNGGFPDYIKYHNVDYLKTFIDNIVYRDIIVRYGLTNARSLKELTSYLITNFCGKISNNNLKDLIGVKNGTTVKNYIEYLENSYLVSTITKFDYSLKSQIKANRKSYIIDSAIPNSIGIQFTENYGRLLENLVYLHLKKLYDEIYYYSNGNECDFVAKQGIRNYSAFQVCYELNEMNFKRETAGLLYVLNELNLDSGNIITFDEEKTIEQDGKEIRVIPAWKWLLTE